MDDKALVPFSDMKEMATVMGKSMLFGKNSEQLLALMLIAQSEGIHPARAAQEYDIIQGRPALKSQAALARFQDAGGSIRWVERSDTVAEADFSHPQGGTVRVRWDQEKATKAKLWNKRGRDGQDTPWITMPGIMLQWRCVAEGVRVCYPACLNRLYLVEEVQDFEPMRNVTPDDDVAALSDPRDSKGEYSPAIVEGEPAPSGDGTRQAMRDLWVKLNNLSALKYEGAEVFTSEQKKDMNADRHPGGKDPVPSKEALEHLQGVFDKWQTMADIIIERRKALDRELEEGFNLAQDKVD